jgi:hypothetical protein
MQMHSSPFWEGSPGAISASVTVSASASASGIMVDDVLMISGSTTLISTMMTTRIQLPTCHLSISGKMLCSDTSPLSQKWGNKVGRARGSEADEKPNWQKGIQPQAAGEQA